MKKLLVAVDGSEKSKMAVDRAGELAEIMKAEITLLTVVSDIAYHAAATPVSADIPSEYNTKEIMDRINKTVEEKGKKILKEAEKILLDKNIKPEKIIRKGNPAEIICEIAEEEDYDLIILADRGNGKIKRFLLGSTSDKVVRYAKKSVLVVK